MNLFGVREATSVSLPSFSASHSHLPVVTKWEASQHMTFGLRKVDTVKVNL